MAKALFGHVGVPVDFRTFAEVSRLRQRVAELDAEVARLRAANEVLVAARVEDALRLDDDLMHLDPRRIEEPALA